METSDRASACLSHPFHYVPLIIIFQELLSLTKVMSMQKDKVRGQKSRSYWSTQILPQSWAYPVRGIQIYIWLRNDALSLKEPYYLSKSSIKFQGHMGQKLSILTQFGCF